LSTTARVIARALTRGLQCRELCPELGRRRQHKLPDDLSQSLCVDALPLGQHALPFRDQLSPRHVWTRLARVQGEVACRAGRAEDGEGEGKRCLLVSVVDRRLMRAQSSRCLIRMVEVLPNRHAVSSRKVMPLP